MKTSTLISSVAIALSVSSFATAGVVSQFGTLSTGTSDVSFNVGNGIGNNDFWYSNTDVGGKALTLGMKSISYFGQNPNTEYKGDGTWEAQAGTNVGPSGSANAPTWNFIWSVTMDGMQPSANDNLYWSMRITGPNGGNWGTSLAGMAGLSTNFSGPADPVYQNAWVGSFNFLQLSSAQSGTTAGLWDGLAFDPMANGRYTFDLSVFQRTGTGDTQLSTLTMNVDVVPAPGAVALVGLAGLIGRRRRA
jgi:hypothetical protein